MDDNKMTTVTPIVIEVKRKLVKATKSKNPIKLPRENHLKKIKPLIKPVKSISKLKKKKQNIKPKNEGDDALESADNPIKTFYLLAFLGMSLH